MKLSRIEWERSHCSKAVYYRQLDADQAAAALNISRGGDQYHSYACYYGDLWGTVREAPHWHTGRKRESSMPGKRDRKSTRGRSRR